MNLDKYNASVAKALGWRGMTENGTRHWYAPDKPIQVTLTKNPALDWNTLMAAVEKLEKDGWVFTRWGADKKWSVYCRVPLINVSISWKDQSESLALAQCIHAVVEDG